MSSSSAATEEADHILQSVFGHADFRPPQRAVCDASIAGRDVLVVMPTGSGKSLCYQLPALARGGTALVISPLIALMQDQASKLGALGLRVGQIHSGRPREEARATFRAYSEGQLQFLFVAPERFRVPGFLEALVRKKPTLVAVDEAHCISQWGHDFRPDYRMLSASVEALRPSPVMALTATATRAVQRDILEQLGLQHPAVFVQGFRRHNIAIEMVDIAPAERTAMTWKLLEAPEHRPAIVYAPSRRQATELANDLGTRYRCAEYHAGLDARRRHDVQTRFLAGDLEIVVATVAFGMGIDKPDIRTVLHLALPGSVESYYQEIGRAGRDGLPSRAILMQSYADRRLHDFFFEREYPGIDVLERIYRATSAEPTPKELLRDRTRMNEDEFDVAFEKLWVHGGVQSDWEERTVRGSDDWRKPYRAQREHRLLQIDLMLRYVAAAQCRMSALVRYFGDAQDGRAQCGCCDFCAPELCLAQQFRDPHPWEEAAAQRIIAHVRSHGPTATGKLHRELFATSSLKRDDMEELLLALARAGQIAIRTEVFQKDGKAVPFRVAHANPEAPDEMQFVLRTSKAMGEGRAARKSRTRVSRVSKPVLPNEPLLKALKSWRLKEAKARAIPAFRIAGDRVLSEIADNRPETTDELLDIRGCGLKFVEQFGTDVLRVVRDASASSAN